jgi:hypothetical protein
MSVKLCSYVAATMLCCSTTSGPRESADALGGGRALQTSALWRCKRKSGGRNAEQNKKGRVGGVSGAAERERPAAQLPGIEAAGLRTIYVGPGTVDSDAGAQERCG